MKVEESTKDKRLAQARAELEEICKQRGRSEGPSTSKEDYNKRNRSRNKQESRTPKQESDSDVITVWDLPMWARRTQVFEMVRFIGRVEHIELVKGPSGKTKAEIKFETGSYDRKRRDEIWCLPFMNQLLVRVTTGINSYNILRARNRYSTRLLDLPENANEVLLWRQVKKTGARALHIFRNTNGNSMSSATVYFEKEEDVTNSLKFSMFYYNNKLRWAKKETKSIEPIGIEESEDEEMLQGVSTKYLGKRKEAEKKQENKGKVVFKDRTHEKEFSDRREGIMSLDDIFGERESIEIEISDSEEENNEAKRENRYTKESRRIDRVTDNKQEAKRTKDTLLASITQQLRSLEGKIARIGALGPNHS
jgi:hypothetical protein